MLKYILILLLIFPTAILANKKKKADIDAIKGMCGCMDIKFEFAETVSPQKDYKFYENYLSGGRELAFIVEETPDKLVIQHILVIMDTMIVKHWRQDWIYEGEEIFMYDKDQQWIKKTLNKKERKGKWVQKVYQVDDSPRYEGIGSWVMVDGKTYWESIADAPLPRREYSKRKDYNVMKRGNRHEIKNFGWIHEQDNIKIMRGDTDIIIAEEKGWNTYKRIDESNCKAAIDWWADNKSYWKNVRTVWDEYFKEKNIISLHTQINKKPMFSEFFELGSKVESQTSEIFSQEKELIKNIKTIIKKYSKE
tara:strand:- start:1472 stop:2392 length:921 start_codon:yes stop_codon:yes gene_type:complete